MRNDEEIRRMADELAKELGGVNAVGERLDLHGSAVCNWKNGKSGITKANYEALKSLYEETFPKDLFEEVRLEERVIPVAPDSGPSYDHPGFDPVQAVVDIVQTYHDKFRLRVVGRTIVGVEFLG